VTEDAATDRVRRFLLEGHPVRGQVVQLDRSWTDLREHARYPPPVRDLLGEALVASVLLASTLKFEGTLTLQIQGDGAVRLLVAQCSDDFRIRGLARFDETRVTGSFTELIGTGRMTVTIESAERAMRYQGIVPLAGESLAACIDAYFASSEQLPTRVRLAADAARAGGMLVQQLPDSHEEDASIWQRAQQRIAELDAHDLMYVDPESLLGRGAAIDAVRLFAGADVRFECRCNRERVAGLLRGIGEKEVQEVLAEQGSVTVTCEFCHRPYVFDAIDVTQVFGSPAAPATPAPGRLN
jgi:molecular chaperone Hsp33